MILNCSIGQRNYVADLRRPTDISIPLKHGANNPNCYFAEDVAFTVIRSGDFVGSVAEGGVVNHKRVCIAPHGNGTHTETYGHLTDDAEATISATIKSIHCTAQVVSLQPAAMGDDVMIRYDDFMKAVDYPVEAVVIRSLPNPADKLTRRYSGTNPPYLDPEIGRWLNEHAVRHLLTDLPSVDKEEDGGNLLTHRAFWGLPGRVRKDATITELVYVPNTVEDGLYLLNLQVLNIALDVSPSRPVLFSLSPKL